jgi:hypothetical protein
MTGTVPGVRRHRPPVGERMAPEAPATIDLHSHTSRSDGLLTPAELAISAAEAGVRLLAVTDHDTLAGVRDLRRSDAVPAGLDILPGIELNAVLRDREELRESEVHVLGLGVDPDDDALEAALSRQRDSRRVRFDRMVERLGEIGMPIEGTLAELPPTDDDDALGRPRIARAMIACGYADSVEDAFTRHLSRGRPAYVPREGLGPIEAIGAIRAAGGLPTLAHFAEATSHLGFLRELIDAGLGGLEVFHRSYDARTILALDRIAGHLRLVRTGGTDYHGDRETYAEAHAQLAIPPEVGIEVRAALQVPAPTT